MLDKFLDFMEDRVVRSINKDGPVKAIIGVLAIYAYVGFVLFVLLISVYKIVFGG